MKKSPNQIRRLFTLCMLMLLFGSASSFAQQITGKITDASKQPIPGATIMLQGNPDVGTITDMDGVYRLQVPDANSAVIVVSFIGMKTQTIPVSGKSTISVKLEDSFTELDEYVSIGYGAVRKKDLTGAVSSIKTEDLVRNPVANVAEAMQGKLAGVAISSQDGRPGADVSIRIRGGGSITQSNEPLIVVDGILGYSLSDIPADQIESIDVLKDAASTAIYGARGANGVILVTTKGLGTAPGKTTVSYSGYFQSKKAANKLKTLNTQDYLLHTWSYGTALGEAYGDGIAEYFGLGSQYGDHYSEYADVESRNYTDDLLRDVVSQNHNISVSSSTEKTTLAFSANYTDDKGLKINSGYKRANALLKIEHELVKNVKIGFDIKYVQSETEGKESTTSGKGSILSSAYMFRPIDTPIPQILDPELDDVFSAFGQGDKNIDNTYNPYTLTTNIKDITEQQRFFGTTYLNWEIVEGLTFRTEFAGNHKYSEQQFFNAGVTSEDKEAKLTLKRGGGYRSTTTMNYEVQGLGRDHKLSILAGIDRSRSQSTTTKISGKGYGADFDFESAIAKIQLAQIFNTVVIPDATDPDDLDKATYINEIKKQNFSYENKVGIANTSLSYFGRANYSYKGRYLLTATLRADGSSKFAPNNQWGYFPAAAFAWRASDEPFMDGTQDWLSSLKFRLSYGSSGSDAIPYYAWNALYDIEYDAAGNVTYVSKGYYPNPDLKWETTISRNIGVDFDLFDSWIYGSVEAYANYTKDLLGEVPMNASSGFDSQFQNIGKTSNKGIEVSLGAYVVRKQDFTISVNATYSYNKNTIEELASGMVTDYGTSWASSGTRPKKDFLFKEGTSLGTVQGYVSEGFYTTDDFDYDNLTGQYTLKEGVQYYTEVVGPTGNYPNPFDVIRIGEDEKGNVTKEELENIFPGAVKLKDVDGNGTIDEGDVTVLGEMIPKHTGGFGLNLAYKGIDASVNFAYSIGGEAYNISSLISTYGSKDDGLGANKLEFIKDAYKVYDIDAAGDLVAVTNPDALDALNANAQYHTPYYENGVVLSTFIEDASFLRLNSLTLGYTLPKHITQKVAIQRLRVYFTGGNLLTITGYSGLDPEINTNDSKSGSYPTPGLDFGGYPRARTFTFGLNVDF